MVTRISHSPEETAAIGQEWAGEAQTGWVIGLSGDVGAGKTQLVKGIAKGLAIVSGVHSPTFSLVNIYEGGRLSLFHLDLYRLETREQIIAAGLEEYLSPNGVTVIEWAERWFGDLDMFKKGDRKPPEVGPLRWAKIQHMSDTERRISYEDFGA